MSYNVRLFDLYNWQGNKHSRDSIFKFLDDEEPEILCLQEFFWDKTKVFVTRDSITSLLSLPYVAEHYTREVVETYFFGMATFSKFPICNEQAISFKNSSNSCLITDLVIDSDTIRVFNCHLESIRFIDVDYDIISGAKGIMYSFSKIPRLYYKISHAFDLRSEQAAYIAKLAKESPHPVFIVGDFNDSPLSYVYQQIKSVAGLRDAFKESGSGFGGTYNGRLPSYRIDYILHAPSIETSNFTVYDFPYSDHFPISAEFQLPKTTGQTGQQ